MPEPPPGLVRSRPAHDPQRAGRPGVGAWLAIGWLAMVTLGAVLAPFLPLDDPNVSGDFARQGPSAEHLFGTDGIARDVLSRTVHGGRSSLLIGVTSVAIGLAVGGALGLVAGYCRGKVEHLLVALFDAMLAVPALVLALALVAVLASGDNVTSGRRALVVVGALAIVAVPILGRITRANTLVWAQREFVLAARAAGAGNARIMVREVLPNVAPAMLSIALLGVAVAIVAEGGLSLLGVGVALPTPSWGNIIAEGRGMLNVGAPHIVIAPAAFTFLTVLALNYLGDVVRARFDVRDAKL